MVSRVPGKPSLCPFLIPVPRSFRLSPCNRAATVLQHSPSFGTTVAGPPALYIRCTYFCECGVGDRGRSARRTLTRTACTESIGLYARYHNAVCLCFIIPILNPVICTGTHMYCYIVTSSRANHFSQTLRGHALRGKRRPNSLRVTGLQSYV